MTIRIVLLLALMVVAPVARAADLASHSVSYKVQLPADADKGLYAEGQGAFSLKKSCDDWTIGEVFQFGLEKGTGGAPRQLGANADRIEERLTSKESLDGRKVSYQARLKLNARISAATATATMEGSGGQLTADLGSYNQTSDLPAGTLGPAAVRAKLVEALLANQPDPIEIRGIEMMRFHKPIVQRFQRLPPEYMIATTLPKELKASDRDFTKGRTFAVRRRVGDFNEFGDEFWLLHQSGAILRQLIKRQNNSLLLEAREVTLFPAPKCD